jgi:hypothetical protein
MRQFVSMLCCALVAIFAAATSADARDCKAETITATGDPSATQIVAYPSSLLAWRRAVRDAHGAEWNSWRYAQDRDIDCNRVDGKWQCTRVARPCQDTLSSLSQGESVVKKKECKSDSMSSYGRRERTEDKATEQAIWGWRLDTRRKIGSDWAKWENASDTDIDCRKKGSRYQCIAFGTPCLDE